MKKFACAILGALAAAAVSVSAEAANNVRVIIPDYKCIIDYHDVYYRDSVYPLISYKDITYFPMTYEYCHALNLAVSWVEGEGLYIAFHPYGYQYGLPVYDTTNNVKNNTAVLPEYPIYVNGRRIDNTKEEYPLLNFRGVTYFPMTWDYAHTEFSWDTSWENDTFTLDTNYSVKGIFSLLELDEDGAYLSYYPTADDSFSAKTGERMLRLSFEDDSLTEIQQEIKPKENGAQLDAEVKNGRIVFEGAALAPVKAIADGTAGEEDISGIYAQEYKSGGSRVVSLTVYTSTSVPAPYTPFETYVYAFIGEKPVLVCTYAYVDSVYEYGGDIYINARSYSGFRKMTLCANDLYRVSADGTVSRLNDSYTDFGSIKAIGTGAGKLYLKCVWCPERSSMGYYNVSASNDGYFAFDGEKSEKLQPYIYTDDDFTSPDGKIYGIINRTGEIKRIN